MNDDATKRAHEIFDRSRGAPMTANDTAARVHAAIDAAVMNLAVDVEQLRIKLKECERGRGEAVKAAEERVAHDKDIRWHERERRWMQQYRRDTDKAAAEMRERAQGELDFYCPCNETYKCNGEDDHRCTSDMKTCKCEDINTPGAVECIWSGHKSVRALPLHKEADDTDDENPQTLGDA